MDSEQVAEVLRARFVPHFVGCLSVDRLVVSYDFRVSFKKDVWIVMLSSPDHSLRACAARHPSVCPADTIRTRVKGQVGFTWRGRFYGDSIEASPTLILKPAHSESVHMRQFIVVRLISMVFTLFGLSVLVFLLARLIPGDVVQVSLEQAERTPEMVQELRSFFGLDQPLYVQYWRWLSDVLQGDLGTSWRSGNSVMDLILDRLSVTAELTILAMVVSIGLGVPLGILAATRQNSPLDYLVRVMSMFSLSIPEFWQGIMLILVLSITLGWIPSLEYVDFWKDPATNLSIMILPAVSVGTVASANIVRMTRATMLEELRQDYVRTARAKGLHDRVVIYSHALKNTLIPVVTIAGLQIGYLMGGIVVMEAVFTLPGVGRLMLLAISQRDYPLIQGVVLFIATIFVFSNLLVDVLYAYVNPRIRYG